MKVAVIWIDREHAKLFLFSGSEFQMEKHKFAGHERSHHTHAKDSFRTARLEASFFGEAAKALESADRLLVVGPGMAKYHFRNFLTEQAPMVARRIVAVENSDHPTEPQIAAMARELFAKVTA